jgi:CBS domain containing-hemolysin-like protein
MTAFTLLLCEAAPLLLLAALFAAAESALFSLGPARLARLMEDEVPAAAKLGLLMRAPRRLLVTLLLGYEVPNLALIVLLTFRFRQHFAAWSQYWPLSWFTEPLLPSLLLSLLLILVAAETVPRALGAIYSEELSRLLASPLLLVTRIYAPVVYLARRLSETLFAAMGSMPATPLAQAAAEPDIKELVLESSREGLLDVTERELLVNLLRSGEIVAGDIMTPRREIVSVSEDASLAEARSLYERERYSRLPVYREERDRIVGVVMAKDLVNPRLETPAGEPSPLKRIMRSPRFVPESRRIPDLLRDFKRARMHLAMVVDEFGAVSGLVTMEDVLEEIFGEVREKEEEAEFEPLGENHWRALGRMPVIDFNARAGVSLPTEGARNLSGLALGKLGRRPRPGDEVLAAGFRFRVVEARGINIHRLEIRREPKR